MTPDLSILIGFARGVLLSFRCTCQCLHSGLWIRSGAILFTSFHILSVLSIIFNHLYPLLFSGWGGRPQPHALFKAIHVCCNKEASSHHVCNEECLYRSCCLHMGCPPSPPLSFPPSLLAVSRKRPVITMRDTVASQIILFAKGRGGLRPPPQPPRFLKGIHA